MKPLIFVLVFLLTTGVSTALHNVVAGRSRVPHPVVPDDGIDRLLEQELPFDLPTSLPAPVIPLAAAVETDLDELGCARLAARCGDRMLDLGKRDATATAAVRQALLHYRASLAHEATLPRATELFTAVRARLAEAEALVQQRDKPAAASAPAARAVQSPVALPKASTPVSRPRPPAVEGMVGPDGVPIRRADPAN